MFSILPDIETADCARSGRIEISGSMKANVFRFMVRLIHGKVNLMSVIVKWTLPVLWREMRDESGDMTMGYPPYISPDCVKEICYLEECCSTHRRALMKASIQGVTSSLRRLAG